MHYEKAYINGNRKEGKQPHPSLAQWSLPIPPPDTRLLSKWQHPLPS